MARPTTITDAELLDAARAVFIERGPGGTTAEVAARAGVSEGTLFKRFGSKTNLFECAMNAENDVEGLVEGVAYGAKGKPAAEVLLDLGMAMLVKFERIVPMIVTHMGGTTPGDNIPPIMKTAPPPVRLLRAVEGLFGNLVEDGKLAPVNVTVLARSFVGAIFQYVFLAYVVKRSAGIRAHPVDGPTFVAEYVTLTLYGALPEHARKHSPAPATKPKTSRAPAPTRKKGRHS